MIKQLDRLLDRVTMYRLLIYYLLGLLGVAMMLGALGYLAFSPIAIAFTAAYVVAICWVSNKVFAAIYHAPANPESPLITALILALIITPTVTTANLVFLTAASGLAMASKYLLAIRKQHILNPAAIAVVLTAFAAGDAASWWVGSAVMAPFVAVGGLLLMRKIKRFQMIASFVVAAFGSSIVLNLYSGKSLTAGLLQLALQSSLLFLAFVMLTEPMTSPATVVKQRWYGLLAGALFPPQLHLGAIYSTPELVLVISNVFSYLIEPKVRLSPKLVQKKRLTANTVDLVFAPDRPLAYKPGQYLEWTLPHAQADERGSRRYFTLASSPTEPTLRIGMKFSEQGSSYKRAMLAMTPATPFGAAQLGGDFVLPDDASRKLAFIAGGIGVTPFRSMTKYLLDTGAKRDVTLLYGERSPQGLAYSDVFEAARTQFGMGVSYVYAQITAEKIAAEIPDYLERLFYLSGPQPMVVAIKRTLKQLGVSERNIKVDFFPGYI